MSTDPNKTDEMRQLSILAEIYFTLFEKFEIDANNPDERRLNQLKGTSIGYFMNGIFDTLTTQSREQAFVKLKTLKNLQDKWDESIPGPFILPQKFQPERSMNGKRPFMILGETQSADGNSTSPTLTNESPVKRLKIEQNGRACEANEDNIETKNSAAALKSGTLNYQGYNPPKHIVDIYRLFLPVSTYAVLGSQKRPTSRVFCESLVLKHSVMSKALEKEENEETLQKMLEEEGEDLVGKIETEERMNDLLSDEAEKKQNHVLDKTLEKESDGSPDLLAQALGLSPDQNNKRKVLNLENGTEEDDRIMEIETEMKEDRKSCFLDIDQRSKLSSEKGSKEKTEIKGLSKEIFKSEMAVVDNSFKEQTNSLPAKMNKEGEIEAKQDVTPKTGFLSSEENRELNSNLLPGELLSTEKILGDKITQLSLQQNLIDMRKNTALKNEANTLTSKKLPLETSGIPEVGKDSSTLLQRQSPNVLNNKNETSLKASAFFSELLQRKADSTIKFDSAKLLKLLQQEQEKQKSGPASGNLKSS